MAGAAVSLVPLRNLYGGDCVPSHRPLYGVAPGPNGEAVHHPEIKTSGLDAVTG